MNNENPTKPKTQSKCIPLNKALFSNISPNAMLKWLSALLFIELVCLIQVIRLDSKAVEIVGEAIIGTYSILSMVLVLIWFFFLLVWLKALLEGLEEKFVIKNKTPFVVCLICNTIFLGLILFSTLGNFQLALTEGLFNLLAMTVALIFVILYGKRANFVYLFISCIFLIFKKAGLLTGFKD